MQNEYKEGNNRDKSWNNRQKLWSNGIESLPLVELVFLVPTYFHCRTTDPYPWREYTREYFYWSFELLRPMGQPVRKSYNIGRSNCHWLPWGVRVTATQWSKKGPYPETQGFLEASLGASMSVENGEQATHYRKQPDKVKTDLSVKTWLALWRKKSKSGKVLPECRWGESRLEHRADKYQICPQDQQALELVLQIFCIKSLWSFWVATTLKGLWDRWDS